MKEALKLTTVWLGTSPPAGFQESIFIMKVLSIAYLTKNIYKINKNLALNNKLKQFSNLKAMRSVFLQFFAYVKDSSFFFKSWNLISSQMTTSEDKIV
jgi:hypothetical protein